MKLLGLIGNPISHSRSPELFRIFFSQEFLTDWDYRLFPLENIEEMKALLDKNPEISGFNVTIPFKQSILPYLHAISPEAAFIGAVNTVLVKKKENGRYLSGHNTDVYGFEKALLEKGISTESKALILGTGGSSKAVQFVLRHLHIPFKTVSRTAKKGDLTYSELEKAIMQKHTLIIQTTPLGMHPDIQSFPDIPFQYITPDHFCFDLIYNPEKTRFLQLAEEMGASVCNGSKMLQYQAEKAWELFQQNDKLL